MKTARGVIDAVFRLELVQVSHSFIKSPFCVMWWCLQIKTHIEQKFYPSPLTRWTTRGAKCSGCLSKFFGIWGRVSPLHAVQSQATPAWESQIQRNFKWLCTHHSQLLPCRRDTRVVADFRMMSLINNSTSAFSSEGGEASFSGLSRGLFEGWTSVEVVGDSSETEYNSKSDPNYQIFPNVSPSVFKLRVWFFIYPISNIYPKFKIHI